LVPRSGGGEESDDVQRLGPAWDGDERWKKMNLEMIDLGMLEINTTN
jgi:hypothetical protein